MRSLFILFFIAIGCAVMAQPVYQSTSSKISFHAGTPVEDIDATSTRASSFLNTSTGEVVIQITIRDFHFPRSLMEQHFNENYLESEKHPKATFKGKIENLTSVNFNSTQPVDIKVTGTLTLHGVTKDITIPAKVTSNNKKITGEAKFTLKLEDYNITRPKILWEKIAESVDIVSLFTYEPYKK